VLKWLTNIARFLKKSTCFADRFTVTNLAGILDFINRIFRRCRAYDSCAEKRVDKITGRAKQKRC
jgi:hypothetical protein